MSTGDCLNKMKNKSHVTFYFTFVENFSCFDALPSSCDLDKDSTDISSSLLIESDNTFGSFHCFIFVETESGINFSWYEAFDLL